ncbi:MAG: PqqD family protein [Blautia sp.]|nr:PqqD family protein [Blautia sp.]
MRLKFRIETIGLDGKIIGVPVGEEATACFGGVLKLNDTAAYILELLKSEITEQEIIDRVEKEYKVSRDVLEKDVKKILNSFEERGFLTE